MVEELPRRGQSGQESRSCEDMNLHFLGETPMPRNCVPELDFAAPILPISRFAPITKVESSCTRLSRPVESS